MKEAFTYMFKDNKFGEKYFSYFVFMFAGLFLPLLLQKLVEMKDFVAIIPIGLLSVICSFVTAGYYLKCIKAISIQQDNYLLPFLGIFDSFKLGFKYMVAILIVSFCWGILFIIPFLNILVFILAIVFLAYYSFAYTWIFAHTEGFRSYLRIKFAGELIGEGKKNYFCSLVKAAFAGIITTVASAVICIPIYLILKEGYITNFLVSLVAAIVGTYASFISAYFIAKSIKPECINILD